MYLLNNAYVALVAGSAFGIENCVRISYATSEERLLEACKRIKNQLDQFSKLEIIGDITCDIEGSVPTTIRSSTIENPIFYLDRQTLQETHIKENNLAIMAVDNLPSELPRDASFEFSDGIVKHVLPFLIEKDDGRILNATIIKEGRFLEKYNYLKNFINS